MLVLHPVGRAQAAYYLNGPGPGSWLGSGCAALGLREQFDGPAFGALLAGRTAMGESLTARRAPNRRAGFDLVFAAPKSVSLLAGLVSPADSGRMVGAHDAAVDDALGYLERWGVWTRRGGHGELVPVDGLLAGAFRHRSSWAGDPHLHTHVVAANLVRGTDGRWSALDGRSLYRHSRAAGAVYQASLRHHVAAAGLRLGWSVRSDGLADVVGVPRAAIEACSTRSHQLRSDIAAAGATGARSRKAAAGRTRQSARLPDEDWEARAGAAGLDRRAATDLLAAPAATLVAPPRSFEDLLTEHASTFIHADVVAALAATFAAGAPAAALEREATRLLGTAVPVDRQRIGAHEQWTTPRVRHLEGALVDTALGPGWGAAGLATVSSVEAAIRARSALSPQARAAVRRLAVGGAGVEILGAASVVSQAAVLDAARAAWESCGHGVAVVAPSARSEARWRALAGLQPMPPGPIRPSIVVVDQSDRLSTVALHRVIHDAAARGAKVVLVAGGTAPPRRLPHSPALADLARRLGAISLDATVLNLSVHGPMADVIEAGRDGTVRVAPTAADAARQLVDDWYVSRAGRVPATMVALGPDEAEQLNTLARARRLAAGELSGAVLHAGARELRAGDELRVLRRDPRLGVPAGCLGVIAALDPEQRTATVVWPGRTAVIAADTLAGPTVSYAYATTPAYLRHGHRGPVLALGPHLEPNATAYVVSPEPARPPHGIGAVTDLVEALDPPARALPRPTRRSLAELTDERDRLGSALLAGAPPDVAAELRRVGEDRGWLLGTTGPDHREALAELDRRHRHLTGGQADRARWLEAHRGDLETWAAFEAAIAWRTEALARGAELAPSPAVAQRLGPPPLDEAARRAWRQAAGTIEAHRERWGQSGDAVSRPPEPTREQARARRAAELQVLVARRVAERAVADRAVDHRLDTLSR